MHQHSPGDVDELHELVPIERSEISGDNADARFPSIPTREEKMELISSESVPVEAVSRQEELRRIIYPKLLYFTLYGGWACLLPFLPLHFAKVGLDESQIGFLGFVSRLVALAAIPVWSVVADKMKDRYKNILLFAIGGYVLSVLSISQFRTFSSLVILVAIANSFGAPIGSLVDTSILQLLRESKNSQGDFGKQRLWASISWGILALLIGWAVTRWSIAVAFLSFAFFLCLTALEIGFFCTYKYQPVERDPPLSDLRAFFTNSRNLLFYALIFAMGYGNGVVENFLGPRVQALGGNERILGAANFIDSFSELPFYFFSAWMISKIGYTGVLSLAALSFVVRLTIYSMVVNPWMCLVAEPLHGLTFAAMWAAAVSYSDAIAPVGLSASAQGILGNIFFGIGPAVGALLGGWLNKHRGAVQNFLFAAAVVATGLLVFSGGHIFLRFSRTGNSDTLVATAGPEDEICGELAVPLPPLAKGQ